MKSGQSAERVLHKLKTQGPATAAMLAEPLGMTSMGVRQHLKKLAAEGLVETFEKAEQVGRPKLFWKLSGAGHRRFPDRHAELTLSLVNQVEKLFGKEGLERLIEARQQEMEERYRAATASLDALPDRLQALADARSDEGYMAEVIAQEDGSWLLVEHHCPICAAATRCQGFCRSELEIFRDVLGAHVTRTVWLQDNGRHCAYLVSEEAREPAVMEV
ncbi:helix-turn-helix transcriptional regulator [Acanthopleuribacter pedis]|uniref:Transcriptional regulator n=1 Tax=Acanthopleuribacter pedis TaxID=442870 RepID=A0A8J7QL16_9BACT|nr:metalloregulator ArsR/SmtB family transcription factor [Acanthopleuribacter pedis]MBO1319930.1 transcriptional regulator [Acanthopleuribacter pedis]